MSYRVSIGDNAHRDADEIVTWYEQQQPGLGEEFLAALLTVFDGLTENPQRHAPATGKALHRRALMQRFPFSVVFSVTGSEVRVVAIAHHNRRPGAWER